MRHYSKLAKFIISLYSFVIKGFEFFRSLMLILKNTILFGFIFIILKEPLKISNDIFSFINNLTELLITLTIIILIVKLSIIIIKNSDDADSLIEDGINNLHSSLTTIAYKLIPIKFATRMALESTKTYYNSELANLVIVFLISVLVIKYLNVAITSISDAIIDGFEYLFNTQMNKIAKDDFNKLNFIKITDCIATESYKNECSFYVYKFKLFKFIPLTIFDNGMITNVVYKDSIAPTGIAMQIRPFKLIKLN